MNRLTARLASTLALALLVCLGPVGGVARAQKQKQKKLKPGDAQKLIAALSLLELNKGAVVVREITPTEVGATVLAGVKVAVRYTRDEKGVWRAEGFRTGDRQWEDFALLDAAGGGGRLAGARAALDSFAAELDGLARAAAEAKKREKEKGEASGGAPEEGGATNVNTSKGKDKEKDKAKNKEKSLPAPPEEPELVRGALRVAKPAAALSAMGKSAVAEVEVETSFEIVREGGSWRVASAGIAGERIADFESVVRALDDAKAARARAELETLAAALEAYRRDRGFYVVADTSSALVDHLNPRYTKLYTRFDPWHRPYDYEGEASRYVLRSNGPDGKPNTGDDVTVKK